MNVALKASDFAFLAVVLTRKQQIDLYRLTRKAARAAARYDATAKDFMERWGKAYTKLAGEFGKHEGGRGC